MAQQQQYVQYIPQPAGSYPGATAYAYPGGQPAQVIQMQPTVLNSTRVVNNYNQDGVRAALVLGIIQFIIGCACICFQSGSSNLEGWLGRHYLYTVEFLGTGIWCGILFLLTGIFGICASKKNAPGLIITFMVFNIISSLAIWILLSFAATNLSSIRRCLDGEAAAPWYMTADTIVSCTNHLYSAWMAMDGLMVALALIEFIVALTSAAYCCKAVCTCCLSNASMVIQQPASGVYLPTTTTQQQQFVMQQQQQFVMQQQQLPADGKPYPVQATPYGLYSGGMPSTAAYAPPYPQQATGTPAQYPTQYQAAYGNPTATPAGSAAALQAHASPSVVQPMGAGYAVAGSYPQTAGGITQPLHPSAPVAPDAHSDIPDVKAPLLPPDYNTAVKL